MNIDKIYEYKYKLEKDLTFEEIVKKKDKNILNNMSYYDTTKPKEV